MRRRILLLVVGMTVLVVLAFAVPLTVLIRNNTRSDAISDLSREAGDVARTVGQYGTDDLATYLARLKHDVSVRLPSGSVIGTPPPGKAADLPALPSADQGSRPLPQAAGGGPPTASPTDYANGVLMQLRFGIFRGGRATPGEGGRDYVVRVYATDDEVMSGARTPLLLLGGVALLLVALGVALGEVLTRRIVRPLVHTSETAQRLAAGDITARATTSGPAEVADVGRALNRLADRIDQLIAEERETIADLSHRLRTPMTALRLDAEALRDPAEAERVGVHVTALERMLTAVIRAARRPQREGRLPSADATAVVGERVEFWSALAEDQGRGATVALPAGPVTVRAGAEDLAAAVDALLENVIAHTPEGTPFAVDLTVADGGATLEVSDDGPGLPEDAQVRGRSDRGSSGLGLDIARRCAESSGGSMTLASTTSGGARVTLHLGGTD
ncbi:Signal transduction histidine kinase [Jatrophihabitans endophyticus]|uniref:histidine kinase n=1 Tax=Jatrophihabitans endophyticus TaxID=1206085 RepID=A0A1M5R0Z8_9ACTN|nr:HAMP domain-containing sensor histidine kinase [Jatrophihabitans endophyticus]SHH19821.1 Signal transduction histidine kinase [Jatrophihabitans endophyticus]